MTAIDRSDPDRARPRAAEPGAAADLTTCLRLVARGDADAFDTVYDQVAATVFGIVRRVVRDPAQSEEVTQDVLLEVWRNAAKFDPGRGSATAWVMTLTRGSLPKARTGPIRATKRR